MSQFTRFWGEFSFFFNLLGKIFDKYHVCVVNMCNRALCNTVYTDNELIINRLIQLI